MSISIKDLTIVIVTYKSELVIDRCIKSINKNLPIIIVENSNDLEFKSRIEKMYQNVNCILTNNNLGMGAGNNVGIFHSKTKYVLILNPDTILYNDTVDNLLTIASQIDFSILAPISDDINYPNFKNEINFINNLIEVEHVDGYAMLINKIKFNNSYFDEKFFLFLENNDLCKRVKINNGKIYVLKNSKIKHFGGKSVSVSNDYNLECFRSWHWMWSRYYYSKKYYGLFYSLIKFIPILLTTGTKVVILFLINSEKKRIYLNRFLGLYNSIIGNSSFKRLTK